MKTPRKLNIADIVIAMRGRIARVVTHVAMELGASVQPLTRITPKVSSVVIHIIGVEDSRCVKSRNDIRLFSLYWRRIFRRIYFNIAVAV